MPGTVYHVKTNTVPDITNSGYGVLPSDWNSNHQVTLSLSGPEVIGAFGNNNRVSFSTNGFGQINANWGGAGGTDLSGAFVANTMATVSTDASGNLQISVNAVPAITLSAGGSSTTGNAVALLNGNGVSFGLAGPFITASIVPGSTVFSGPAIRVSGQPVLSNNTVVWTGSNITLSQVGSTINLIGNPAQTNFTFSNSNNVSFGTNGLVVTASVQPLTIGVGADTFVSQSLYFVGSNNITVTDDTLHSSVIISGPTLTSLSFSNANGVSFGVNASTLTASVSQTLQPAVNLAIPGSTTYTSGTVNLVAGSNITLSTAGQSISLIGIGTNAFSSQTLGVSVGGNVAGAPTLVSQGSLVFAGGNNVTLSQAGSNITINAGVSGAQINFSAGTTSTNLSAITFSNSNGISFGISNGVMTATVNTTSHSLSTSGGTNATLTISTNSAGSTIAASVPAQTAYQFSNSNGVTFGTNGSTVTASVAPAGITISGGTTSNSFTAVTFSNSNNVSFGLNTNGVITATASYTTQTNYVFSNSNGVSFGTNGSTVTASVVTSSPGVQVSAGASLVQSATQLVFSNSNNLNFGLSGSTITASAVQQSITISASGSSGGYSALTFSNSNSITFGNSQGTITATVSYPAPTYLSLLPAGNTAGNSTLYSIYTSAGYIVGGNNVTVSQTSNSLYINAGTAAPAAMTFSGGTQSGALGSIVFTNANGVSWQLNGSTMSASVNNVPAMTISGSNTSATTPILKFSNGNGVSWSYDTGGSFIQASINTNNNITIAANGSTNTVNQIVFSNSNSITFGLTGSTVTATVSYPTQTSLSFSNLNNVTFGIAGSTLTASVLPPTAQIQISDSATSSTFTNVQLGTKNGMTLFLSASSIIGSYTVPTQTSVSFSNANNVTFGLAGSTVTASASYSQSTQSATYSAANTSYGLTALSLIQSTGNVVFSFATNSKLYAIAYESISAGANNNTVSYLIFSNSNNVSFGFDGASVITATATISQSNQAQTWSAQNGSWTGTALTFGTNGNVTMSSSSSAGGTSVYGNAYINVSAGTTSNNSNSFIFSNANGISFGLNANTVTASYNSTTTYGLTFSAGTTSSTYNAVTFSNANNVSFGLNNGTITATASFAQTVDKITVSAPGGSYSLSSPQLSFSNGGNVNFYTAAGSCISGSAFLNVSAGGGTSNSLSGLTFSNLNGITFGLSTGANVGTITASYTVPTQSNQTVGLYIQGNTSLTSSGTFDARSFSVSCSTNITGIYSNGALILSGGAGGAGAASWYATGANTTVATSGAANAGSMYISAVGGILSAGVSSNTIYISGPGSTSFQPLSVGISTQGNTAGTTGFFTNEYQLVGGSNISLSQSTNTNGATLSIIGGVPSSQSVSANGNLYLTTTSGTAGSTFIFNAAPQLSQWSIGPAWPPVATTTLATLGQGTFNFFPLIGMPPMTCSQLAWPISCSNTNSTTSAASSGVISMTVAAGLYSLNGGTALSLITASSGSQNYALTVTGSASTNQHWGIKDLSMPFNMNYTGGDLWIGVMQSSTSTSWGTFYSFSNIIQAGATNFYGQFGATGGATNNPWLGYGRFTATSSAPPVSINLASNNGVIDAGPGIGGVTMPLLKFRGI